MPWCVTCPNSGRVGWHIADGAARLRNVAVQVQNQTNQSLYTHGLAIQQNEQYLIERMRRLEQMLREQTLTIAELQAARPRLDNAAQAMPAVEMNRACRQSSTWSSRPVSVGRLK